MVLNILKLAVLRADHDRDLSKVHLDSGVSLYDFVAIRKLPCFLLGI